MQIIRPAEKLGSSNQTNNLDVHRYKWDKHPTVLVYYDKLI